MDDVVYTTLYSGGAGETFTSCALHFDDKKVFVKLEIDGDIIFDINVEAFRDISNLDEALEPDWGMSWNDKTDVFYFYPKLPLIANNSVVLSARSKAGENKKYKDGVILAG